MKINILGDLFGTFWYLFHILGDLFGTFWYLFPFASFIILSETFFEIFRERFRKFWYIFGNCAFWKFLISLYSTRKYASNEPSTTIMALFLVNTSLKTYFCLDYPNLDFQAQTPQNSKILKKLDFPIFNSQICFQWALNHYHGIIFSQNNSKNVFLTLFPQIRFLGPWPPIFWKFEKKNISVNSN